MRRGARPLGEATAFRVWAPRARSLAVSVAGRAREQQVALEPGADGVYSAIVEGVGPGDDYVFVLDGSEQRADPASRWQPHGVVGPSRVVDPSAFSWNDGAWRGVERADLIIYELHVGTFTGRGTFEGVIAELGRLRDLGVTAIELMPIAEFPGARNWGYDGVFAYAPQSTYGGPSGLAALVDAAHAAGLAVLLDVVYNHVGPEGNVLCDFGPYFTDRYQTPWGDALNFDGPDSEEVRGYFIESALQWVADYHVDGLRLDAIHAICDFSARPFLAELADAVHGWARANDRLVHVIAESDRNDPLAVRERDRGGLGLDGIWNDDFHHAIHARLTGERDGYYADFGGVEHVAKAMERRFVYEGEYSEFRRRRHGAPAADLDSDRFVVFVQNHDQVGNRACGERLSTLVGRDALRLAAAVVLLSPFVPLLFMGEEYGEVAPFLYFVDHRDPRLLAAVRKGRRSEFRAFGWRGEVPDPAAEETFARSRLDPEHTTDGEVLALYRELIRLRREEPALRAGTVGVDVVSDDVDGWIRACYRPRGGRPLAVLWNFAEEHRRVPMPDDARWRLVLSTAEPRFGGDADGASLAAADRSAPIPAMTASVFAGEVL
jgi:maltooligosyltrehalose trehalohydrolase